MSEPSHSKYSASGFEAAMLCPGKPVMESGKPDNSNAYSREGTAAHQLLEWCLKDTKQAAAFAGRVIEVEGDKIVVDDDMVDRIQWTIDTVYDYAAGNMVIPETRVNYAEAIGVGEADGWGTADVIIARDDELVVMDLKYGRGVEVIAERNPQMMLYGLGALAQCDGIMGDFKRVRLVVLQPRTSRKPSEWDCSVDELRGWAATEAWDAVEQRQQAAGSTMLDNFLRPGEKQCKFCKAKATCPALRNDSLGAVFGSPPPSADEFENVSVPSADHIKPAADTWLSAVMSKADMIEDWLKAVRAEVERRLLAGESVPGFKVVQGKRGARQWTDAKAAEQMLKTFRVKLEDMYDMKVISPTSAEKLAKAETIGKRQWPKLQELITQSEGKPHVAPASDPRPPIDIRPVVEDFDNLADDLA